MEILYKIIGEQEYGLFNWVAIHYFEEAKLAFINSSFTVCIIMCQLVCAEMLKSPYRNRGMVDVVNDFGFKQLIDRARKDNFIPSEDKEKLNEMRNFRNSLEHTKDHSDNRMMTHFTGGHALYEESKKRAIESMKVTNKLMTTLRNLP